MRTCSGPPDLWMHSPARRTRLRQSMHLEIHWTLILQTLDNTVLNASQSEITAQTEVLLQKHAGISAVRRIRNREEDTLPQSSVLSSDLLYSVDFGSTDPNSWDRLSGVPWPEEFHCLLQKACFISRQLDGCRQSFPTIDSDCFQQACPNCTDQCMARHGNLSIVRVRHLP